MPKSIVRISVVVALFASSALLRAQGLDAATKARVENEIHRVMDETGVPSAQVGIVQGGKVVYTAAFGDARLATADKPALKAVVEMHYAVGSISKQFTTVCVLLLVQRGVLKLDDPVSKWYPELTRANDVTVRNLLTHTSGYSDYAPQDYTIPEWTKPGDPEATVRKWAGKPLDFEPGTKWQYSNTNFVLAGLIVQKASGVPFPKFLRENVLEPLRLKEVLDLDTDRARMEPTGYKRNALGPLRPAMAEAPGWYFADGQLAMPVQTLLEWDISLLHHTLLKPASYNEMFREQMLKDGDGSHYGLGVQVGVRDGHPYVGHSGEIGGFVAMNVTYPQDDAAIAVLTNQEASSAAGLITSALSAVLLPKVDGVESQKNASPRDRVRGILADLQQGKIDRSLFTGDANFYFSQQTIEDFHSSLAPLGELQHVTEESTRLRGGMTMRSYTARFAQKSVTVSTYWMPDGQIEQFLVEGRE
ncbi:MAG: beta-lactamase family protein [Acidobacteria bacterium]|nr:beta-lactamase family protein [Acidobacteriota bacterium]